MTFKECPICGKQSLQVWSERTEAWGFVTHETYEECVNKRCGEEECDNCGEYDCTCEEDEK